MTVHSCARRVFTLNLRPHSQFSSSLFTFLSYLQEKIHILDDNRVLLCWYVPRDQQHSRWLQQYCYHCTYTARLSDHPPCLLTGSLCKVEGYTESLQLMSRLSSTAKNPSCTFSTHNHPHGLQFLLVPYDCLKPHFIKVGDRNIVRFNHLGFTPSAIYHVLDTSSPSY